MFLYQPELNLCWTITNKTITEVLLSWGVLWPQAVLKSPLVHLYIEAIWQQEEKHVDKSAASDFEELCQSVFFFFCIKHKGIKN